MQNKMIVIGDCPLTIKCNITKTAPRVCGGVQAADSFAYIGAGTAIGGSSVTHAFDAVSI